MDLINKIRQISHFCAMHDNNCTNCSYYRQGCAWEKIIRQIVNKTPDTWDISKLKTILEGTDENY